MKKTLIVVVVAAFVSMSMGCASWSNTAKGGATGAAAGGVIGAIIGNQTGNTAVGAIMGAAIGGAAGAYIGNYMDKQAAEMREDIEGAEIERVGEGIKITFDSGLLFAVDQSRLTDESQENLAELADILQKYEDTNILLEGHTDSSGPEEYNLELSEERAQSVANYLAQEGVRATRFDIMAYGETQPVASNETASGRQENRRVEVAIFANDKLKRVAKQETS